MPLTAAEWLSENIERQELAVMNIPLAMEAYNAYSASFVSDDVEKAIDEWIESNGFVPQRDEEQSMAHRRNVILKGGVEYGYSLAAGERWVNVTERTPSCFMSGGWDGLKSEPVLAQDKDGKYYVAVVYQGILDGNKFCDWYDIADYEIHNVVKWQYINP